MHIEFFGKKCAVCQGKWGAGSSLHATTKPNGRFYLLYRPSVRVPVRRTHGELSSVIRFYVSSCAPVGMAYMYMYSTLVSALGSATGKLEINSIDIGLEVKGQNDNVSTK